MGWVCVWARVSFFLGGGGGGSPTGRCGAHKAWGQWDAASPDATRVASPLAPTQSECELAGRGLGSRPAYAVGHAPDQTGRLPGRTADFRVYGRLPYHSTAACFDGTCSPRCLKPSLPLKENPNCVFLSACLLARLTV